jgi:hypothetical protein
MTGENDCSNQRKPKGGKMSKSKVEISVFVAYSGEMIDELKLIEEIATEINDTYGGLTNLFFKIETWKKAVAPGVDAYPQNVINRQIEDKYDVVIALFGSKLGTPTKNFRSGTVEELNTAIKGYKAKGRPKDIFVYFRNELVSIQQIAILQLQEVLEYKAELSLEGVLYSEYKSKEEFSGFIRNHLFKVVRDMLSGETIPNRNFLFELGATAKEEIFNDGVELGILDYEEIFRVETDKATAILSKYNLSLQELTQKTKENNNNHKKLTITSPTYMESSRQYIKNQIEIWNLFSTVNTSIASVYQGSLVISQNALKNYLLLQSEYPSDAEDQELFGKYQAALKDMKKSMSGASSSTRLLMAAIVKVPNLTKELIQAKKRILEIVSGLLRATSQGLEMVENNLFICEKKLSQIPK